MGMKASNAIATFFKYLVLILVGLIMIYPLLWMVSATFKDNSEIFAGIGLWIKNPTLEGYKNALNNFGGSINIQHDAEQDLPAREVETAKAVSCNAGGDHRADDLGQNIRISVQHGLQRSRCCP